MKKTKDKDNKDRSLEVAMSQIEKIFGKGSIMKLGDSAKLDIDTISTGSIGLDIALGAGGIPKGRVSEIFGQESSGKTTLALHVLVECQKKGGVCAFIDAEHALDPKYAKQIGANIDDLVISQPDGGEQALEIVDTLVRSQAVDLIIIDSVAALVPRAELEGDMGDTHIGLQARLMSQALRKLTSSINKSNCTVIFINQVRMKIGGMSFMGPSETTTGGNALKFYSSIRLKIQRIRQIKDKEVVVGSRLRVSVVKNKIAPPFKTAEFDIMYGEGISKEGEIIDMGLKYNIIMKTGSWFSYGDKQLAQGREKVRSLLKQDSKLMDEIQNDIKKASIESQVED